MGKWVTSVEGKESVLVDFDEAYVSKLNELKIQDWGDKKAPSLESAKRIRNKWVCKLRSLKPLRDKFIILDKDRLVRPFCNGQIHLEAAVGSVFIWEAGDPKNPMQGMAKISIWAPDFYFSQSSCAEVVLKEAIGLTIFFACERSHTIHSFYAEEKLGVYSRMFMELVFQQSSVETTSKWMFQLPVSEELKKALHIKKAEGLVEYICMHTCGGDRDALYHTMGDNRIDSLLRKRKHELAYDLYKRKQAEEPEKDIQNMFYFNDLMQKGKLAVALELFHQKQSQISVPRPLPANAEYLSLKSLVREGKLGYFINLISESGDVDLAQKLLNVLPTVEAKEAFEQFSDHIRHKITVLGG